MLVVIVGMTSRMPMIVIIHGIRFSLGRNFYWFTVASEQCVMHQTCTHTRVDGSIPTKKRGDFDLSNVIISPIFGVLKKYHHAIGLFGPMVW